MYDGVNRIALCLNFAEIPGSIDNIEWAKTILKVLTLLCFLSSEAHKYSNCFSLCYFFIFFPKQYIFKKMLNQQQIEKNDRMVVDAMSYYKNKNSEIRRFETLLKNFSAAVHLDLKIAYMTFINVNQQLNTNLKKTFF